MPDGGDSTALKDARARELALGLMGACALPATAISEGANWQNGASILVGRAAILAAVKPAPQDIAIDEVVTHGKAAAVSGKFCRQDGTARLFCHMIRYTNASASQVASIVSFEHQVRAT